MQARTNNDDERPATNALWQPRSLLLLGLLVLLIVYNEYLRLTGGTMPAPFALLFAAGAIAAGSCGLRVGLVAASLGSLYLLYSSYTGYGPTTLTGGPLQLLLGIAIAYGSGTALGYEHDVRVRLLHLLRERERELVAARERLTGSVARTTEQLRQTRSELDDARFQMAQAMRLAPIGVIMIDDRRKLRYVNDAALRQFGMAEHPDEGSSWDDLIARVRIYDRDGRRLEAPYTPVSDALMNGSAVSDLECRISGIDGARRWCSGYVGPIRNKRRDIVGALVMLVDTTGQRETGRELRRLTRLLIKVQEEERGSLARELHEEIGQVLSAIKFDLHAGSTTSAPHAPVVQSMARIDSLTDRIRQLSLDLRPSALDDLGLEAALATFLKRQQVRSGVNCRLDAGDELDRISDESATAAFRIGQEAVNNAIRHASCRTIAVRLSTVGDELQLDVVDDGDGFDVEAALADTAVADNLGLLFMFERARQSGGRLDVRSSAGDGTRIRAVLPLQQGALDAEDSAGINR